MTLKTCAVSVTVTAPDGKPVQNAIVVAELSKRVMYEGVLVPERVMQKTDDKGQAVLNLWPNALLVSMSTIYLVVIKTPQGTVETFNIYVPDADNAIMSDLERQTEQSSSEQQTARLFASLAQIEKETKDESQKAAQSLQDIDKKLADFDARIKDPDYWEGTIVSGQARYPISGATIKEPKLYEVSINGIIQRPSIDYLIHVDDTNANNSEIELKGKLPTGRNWWALTRTVIQKP